MLPRLAAIALLLPLTLAAAGPDPRPALLRAIFPGQTIALLPGAKLDTTFVDRTLPFPWPDALAGEPVYLVSGAPQFGADFCASENLLTEKNSSRREVRIRTLPCPGQPATARIALVQYKFRDANPAGSCWSVGLLARLELEAGVWRRGQMYLLETRHHSSIQRFELAAIDGSPHPALIVESDSGGAETLGSSLQIFDLSNNAFNEILKTSSRLVWGLEGAFTQHLDLPRTRADQARRFHLIKTTYMDKGIRLPQPRQDRLILPRGSGIDPNATRLQKDQIRPIPN